MAVLHELIHLFESKKTEIDNVCFLGDYLGFGNRFKTALMHHPGVFCTIFTCFGRVGCLTCYSLGRLSEICVIAILELIKAY